MASAHDDATNTLPKRLRAAREAAGLSQGQVAKLMDMHRPSISEMEAGKRRITAEELARLADLYDTKVSSSSLHANLENSSRMISTAS